MAITDWPDKERPREKLLALGSGALSEAELLALLFRTGVKGKTAVDLAREALSRFGSLENLLNCSHQKFCQASGLGTAKPTKGFQLMTMKSPSSVSTVNSTWG